MKNKYKRFCIGLISLITLLIEPCYALLSSQQAFPNTVKDHGDNIQVQWHIAKGYQLDANSIKLSQEQAVIKTIESHPSQQHYWIDSATIQLSHVDHTLPLKLSFQGCKGDEACYPPQTIEVLSSFKWATLLGFFVGGLLMAFSPCSLPMAPIILSLISSKRDHTPMISCGLYSFGVLLALVLLGIAATGIGTSLAYWMHQPIVVLLFGTLLLQLAHYSAYESIPSWVPSYSPKIDHLRSHFYYPILLGASSLLIASPCMTPGLAAAVSFATHASIMQSIVGFLALGLGLIIPLLILALSGKQLLEKLSWIQPIATKLIAFGLATVAFIIVTPYIHSTGLLILLITVSLGLVIWPTIKGHYRLLFIFSTLLLAYSLSQTKLTSENQIISMQTKPNSLMFFTADWCQACKPIKDQLNHLKLRTTASIIDTTIPSSDNQALMDHYGVAMPPSMVWIDRSNNAHRYQGAEEIQVLLEALSE